MNRLEEKVNLLRKELVNQYSINYKFNHQMDDNYDDNLALPYAEKCFDYFMKLEGPDRLFKSEEICDGIPLNYYLNMIRNLKEEACLLVAIQNYSIQGVIIFFGDHNTITFDDYEKNGIYNVLKKWHQKGYKVLNYHNHPNSIAARPSNTDIINLNLSTTSNLNIRKALEKYDLVDFEYYDWGVVTEFDFYSEKQLGKSNELLDEWNQVQSEMINLNSLLHTKK